MTPEDWRRLKGILNEALPLETDARDAFLEQACGGDIELLAQCRALIASDEAPWPMLDDPNPNPSPVPLASLAGALLEAPAPRAGERVGAYEILEEIGHGGMGTVYLGRRADEAFQKKVAIKLVRAGMDLDSVLRRFRTERQILANLEHPHIARLLDGGATPDGRPYFVMEYIEGRTLPDWCAEKGLGVRERLRLFLDVCGAAELRPPEPGGAPGHQAGQHPRDDRRHREAARLRHRQADRSGALRSVGRGDGDPLPPADAGLREPRAGARRAGDSRERRLCPGRGAL